MADRCACGRVELDSFIGTYAFHDSTHRRECCKDNAGTVLAGHDPNAAAILAAEERGARWALEAMFPDGYDATDYPDAPTKELAAARIVREARERSDKGGE